MATVEIPQPFVGITGVVDYDQHGVLLDFAMREDVQSLGRFMLVGVEATGTTQVQDEPDEKGRYWHPVGESIGLAAGNEDSGLTIPFVQCNFELGREFDRGVTNVMNRTLHYVQGLQFNGLPWVDRNIRPRLMEHVQTYPNQSIILQAGKSILDNHSPSEVADKLARLPVDYVLFDPTDGSGDEMDLDKVRSFVDEIYQRQMPFGVAVSGGLDDRNIDVLFAPLIESHPYISCIAGDRLRRGKEGETVLDLQKAEQFIKEWKYTLENTRS